MGPEGVAEYWKATLAGAPESTEVNRTNVIRQGNHVVEWVWSGTHTASWVGEAPSGKDFSVRGVSVYDVENGRIQRVSDYMDFYTWLHQIGVLPSLEELGRSLMGSAGRGG